MHTLQKVKKISKKVMLIYLFLLFIFHSTIQAREMRNPKYIAVKIEKISSKKNNLIPKLMQQLQKLIQYHRRFVTKDYIGMPFDRWFISENGRWQLHSKYPILWLTTFPPNNALGSNLYDGFFRVEGVLGYNFVKKIGNIPLHLTQYSNTKKRYILIDMRTVDEMLYEAYNDMESHKRGVIFPTRTLIPYTTESRNILNIINATMGELRYPEIDNQLWRATGFSREQKKKSIKNMFFSWNPIQKIGQKTRLLWVNSLLSVSPPILNGGGFKNKPNNCQFKSFYDNRTFSALSKDLEQWRKKCINSPDIKMLNWFQPDIDKTIKNNHHFGVLSIMVMQHRFEIVGKESARIKYAYSFQNMLENMVKKGRAVKLDAKGTTFWKAAKEIVRNGSPKGWIVYADPKTMGNGRGAILFNVKTGIGVWQPAIYNAITSLIPLAKKINANNAKLFKQVLIFDKLSYDYAIRMQKKSTNSKNLDNAF